MILVYIFFYIEKIKFLIYLSGVVYYYYKKTKKITLNCTILHTNKVFLKLLNQKDFLDGGYTNKE